MINVKLCSKKLTGRKHILLILLILWIYVPLSLNAKSPKVEDYPQNGGITITGVVFDETGESLPGVTITIKGTTSGNITDANGEYTIKVPGKESILVFSYIGMKTQEIQVGESKTINVKFETTLSELDEVVVIGYGRVKKSDLTGSVIAIKPDDINKGNQITAQQALQGKIAGVLVTNSGGAPGQGATIRIRGGSSLSASNDPLIIIDGVAIDNSSISGTSNILGSINPNDIETFTVLKDASSTAIYGSRASNGVVIITTKKGVKGKKSTINYNNNFSIGYNPKYMDVLSADEYRTFIKDYFADSPDAINGLGTASTDWQKEIFRTSFSQEHNISLSGAAKDLPYRLSFGYTGQQGTIKTNSYDRFTGGIALAPQLLDKHLTINLNAKGSYENNKFISNPVGTAVSYDPTRPVYSNESSHGLGYFIWRNASDIPLTTAPTNPVAMLDLRDDKADVYRSIGNAQFDYKIHGFEDLHLNLNLGYDISKSNGKVFVPDDAPQAWTGIGNDGQGLDQKYTQKKKNSQLDFYANYVKEIGLHAFDVMGGYSWQHFWYSSKNDQFNLTGDKIYQQSYVEPEYYLISFFGRFNYTLNNKYMLTATLRNDGSSRFSPDNRWGLFPSAALAWRINEESFLKDSKTLSDLKLRLSYGKTGQQDIGGYYDWQPTYTVSRPNADYQFGDEFITTLRPNGYDLDLRWETTSTYNIGLDYGFFNNRIYGSLDAYLRNTDDLLNNVAVPAGSNLNNMITTNIGSMENKGIEFSISAVPIVRKDFSWDVNLNVTYNKSKITKLTLVDSDDYGVRVGSISGGIGSTAQIHSVGYAPYTFYLNKQKYDGNGKPIEGEYEEGGLQKIKKPAPDAFFGFSSKLNYKKWTLGFNSHANIGNYVYNNVRSSQLKSGVFEGAGWYTNMLTFTRDHGFGSRQYWSDYFLYDASFFRMDNISLGYLFPNFGSNKGISLRVTASVENVFTITGYDGLDPEISNGIDRSMYSRPRIFMIGFNINL